MIIIKCLKLPSKGPRIRKCRDCGKTSYDRGAFYIDSLIIFAVFIALVFSLLTVPEVLIKKQELDYITRSVVRRIERDGMAGDSMRQTLRELAAETGLDADVSFSGPFRGADAKLQIREKFSVTARYTVKVRLFEPTFSGPVNLDVPIYKTLSGVSEVYWKDLT